MLDKIPSAPNIEPKAKADAPRPGLHYAHPTQAHIMMKLLKNNLTRVRRFPIRQSPIKGRRLHRKKIRQAPAPFHPL